MASNISYSPLIQIDVTGRCYRSMLQADVFAVLFMNEIKNLTYVVKGKLAKLAHISHKQISSHNFFYFIDYSIIIEQVGHITIETKEVAVLDITGFFFRYARHLGLHVSTHAEKETRYIQYIPLLLF